MKKMLILTLIAGLILSLTGCATVFKGNIAEVPARTDPEGAKVYVNGEYYGVTPVKLKLDVTESYTIEFRKEGYKPVTRQIHNKVGAGWVVLDVVCGLVPVVVDALTGSWYKLDQSHVSAVLERQQPRP